ncbi:MAG TPA: hypothetical protein VGQ59_11540 [Cyclobacteriaceae bacterium]|nr:hypothetical protein [Cyclobacteriaceae bacterium]
MKRKVKVELTILEANELRLVANNGWADGDYYENGRAGRGTCRQMNAFVRAYEKLTAAIQLPAGYSLLNHYLNGEI